MTTRGDGRPMTRRSWMGKVVGGAAILAAGGGGRADEPAELKGKIIAHAGLRPGDVPYGLIAIDPNTGAWSTLGMDTAGGGRVSPDGRHLAFVRRLDPSTFVVSVLDLREGGEPRRLLDNPGSPFWSPDGKELIISVVRESRWVEAVRIPAAGGEAVKLPFDKAESVVDWSPDGRWLLLRSHRGKGRPGATTQRSKQPLYAVHPDGTGDRLIVPGDETPGRRVGTATVYVRFAPDSRRIALTRTVDDSPSSLYVTDLDGKEPRRVFEGKLEESAITPCWSPDGRWLACPKYVRERPDDRGQAEGLLLIRDDGSEVRRVPFVPFQTALVLFDWRAEV